MTRQALINALVTALLVVLGVGQYSSRALGMSGASGNGTSLSLGRSERHYTMTVRVRPLLFWISFSGVGGGRIVWSGDTDGATGLELLIGSDPNRAPRRINRWGYIAEHVSGSTADLVGLMSQSDEQSVHQADAGTNRAETRHAFKAIHCRLNGAEAQSAVTPVFVAEDFTYKDVEVLLGRIPETGGPVRYMKVPAGTDPGFLFSVREMLHAGVERYRQLGHLSKDNPTPRRYIYNASLFTLSIVSSTFRAHEIANGRDYNGIIESEFEALNTKTGKKSSFKISYGTDGPISEVPVRIVYQPRFWFHAELLLNEDAPFIQVAERAGGK
jgi:hypothetical protein